jgi:hypothetical protein
LTIGVSVRAMFTKSLGAWEMLPVFEDWEKLMSRENREAPNSVGGAILVSDQFVSMATQAGGVVITSTSALSVKRTIYSTSYYP